ncbi:hypothetical protein E2I00_014794, partial [Balaenoptera physalus]
GSKGAKSKGDRSTRKKYARPLEQGVQTESTESRRRRGTFSEIRFSVLPVRKAIPRGCAVRVCSASLGVQDRVEAAEGYRQTLQDLTSSETSNRGGGGGGEDAASEHRVSLARKVSDGRKDTKKKPKFAYSQIPFAQLRLYSPRGRRGPQQEPYRSLRGWARVDACARARVCVCVRAGGWRLRGLPSAVFLKYPPNEPNFDFSARQGWLSGLPRRRCLCLSASLGQDLARSVHSPVSLEPPWGKGWEVNNSQPPVPFVALLSFDTIKVKLIDSYH